MQFYVIIYYLLEDRYSCVPHFALIECQHPCCIIQYCLAVWVEAEPIWKAAERFINLGVKVGFATFAVGSGILVRLLGRVEHGIGRIFCEQTGNCFGCGWQDRSIVYFAWSW